MRKLKAYAFDNMAGVPQDITTPMLRVELETAGITSCLQVPYGEPKAIISGVMVFKNGQAMVLHRAWIYWTAWLIEPLSHKAALALHDIHGKFVRPDGDCTSPRPVTSVDHYHVDTQDGLNALVAAVKAEFGEVETDTGSETFIDGLQKTKKLAADPLQPLSVLERDVAHIKTLLSLAQWHSDSQRRQAVLYQALATAEKLFPGRRKWANKVNNELARFYRDSVRKGKERMAQPDREPGDRMWATMEVERDQRSRAKYLFAVGHTNNAKACYEDAVSLRLSVIELLTEHADHLRTLLAGKKEDEHDYYWHRVAFMEFMLGRFNRMLGRHEESRKHFSECKRIQSLLSTEHYKNQLTSWVRLWH